MFDKAVFLRGEYPTINGSYGGNQEWFRDDVFGNGDLIRLGGCGLISMADTLLYLASQQQLFQPLPNLVFADKLTMSTYQLFVETLFFRYLQPWRNPFFNPAKYQHEANFVLGIQGWQLRRGFNRFYQQRVSRFYSTRKSHFSHSIQQQLKRNRPVPLMIGPTMDMFPKGSRFLGRKEAVETRRIIQFGESQMKISDKATAMGGHWVTVTGYYQKNNQEYVVISSWGEPFVLNLTLYLAHGDWFGGLIQVP